MLILAIILLFFVTLYFIGKVIHDRAVKKANTFSEDVPEFEELSDDAFEWSHVTYHFKLRGMNFLDVKEGHREGYVIAVLNHPVDNEAIMVIDRKFHQLGYLPTGNGYLHRELVAKHRRYLPANVVIDSSFAGDGKKFFFGYVDINRDLLPDLDERKLRTGFKVRY